MSEYVTQASRPLHERHPHMPFYRYRVAFPGFRFCVNRYGWKVIGIGVVVGRHAYAVKWASP